MVGPFNMLGSTYFSFSQKQERATFFQAKFFTGIYIPWWEHEGEGGVETNSEVERCRGWGTLRIRIHTLCWHFCLLCPHCFHWHSVRVPSYLKKKALCYAARAWCWDWDNEVAKFTLECQKKLHLKSLVYPLILVYNLISKICSKILRAWKTSTCFYNMYC